MTCGACGRECRSTSLAMVANEDGTASRKRVCGTCFDGALHIVISVTTVARGEDEEGAKRRDAKAVTRTAAGKIRNIAKGYRGYLESPSASEDKKAFADGRAAGLEQAADILEAGDY